ncbi:hypothetical protein ACWEK7_16035, partial [Streptomyces californicus]
GDDLDASLGRLVETQRQRAEREERTDRFAESASLAITGLDLNDGEDRLLLHMAVKRARL